MWASWEESGNWWENYTHSGHWGRFRAGKHREYVPIKLNIRALFQLGSLSDYHQYIPNIQKIFWRLSHHEYTSNIRHILEKNLSCLFSRKLGLFAARKAKIFGSYSMGGISLIFYTIGREDRENQWYSADFPHFPPWNNSRTFWLFWLQITPIFWKINKTNSSQEYVEYYLYIRGGIIFRKFSEYLVYTGDNPTSFPTGIARECLT